MQKEPKVAAFEGGELRILTDASTSHEAVLALPFSRLLVRMLRVPADQDLAAFAEPLLKAMSPYPDDPLSVSCELVRETADAKIVIAAALPESAADDIAEALDAAKLSVVRIDALALGALRGVWDGLKVEDGARRLVKLRSADCETFIVLDGDQPASIRAIAADASEAEVKRETMLSLLEAEDFNGPKPLAETIERTVDTDVALAGIRARTADEGALDALPESWREVLAETRFKAKLVKNLILAGSLWALAMLVLFGVPVAYGFMTDHVKGLCRQHDRQYRLVADKKAKTELVRKYSDHARGALEILKAVSDRLPAGITLTSYDFLRGDGIRVRGESDDTTSIYEFKDSMVALGAEDGGEAVFKIVKLGSVSSQKGGKQKFDLECKCEEDGE